MKDTCALEIPGGTEKLIAHLTFIHKEKQLFAQMNKLKKEGRLFVGFAWCPVSRSDELTGCLREIRDRSNIENPHFIPIKNTDIKPPTYFKMNEFMAAFQEIVNTYGIPDYKEVNPAVFTAASFPFLFGVMFGDVGHGSVLLLVGIVLCLSHSTVIKKHPNLEGLFYAKYLLLLMGFFATFCGLVYNDLMAIPIFAHWGSCYEDVGTSHLK